MEYNNLLELIKTVSESNISGFQYEDGDNKILISKGENGLGLATGKAEGVVTQAKETAQSVNGKKEEPVSVTEQGVVSGNATEPLQEQKPAAVKCENIVKSPLVGTFYTAPSEEADPFVNIGDTVKKGQTLAIVEAMKLMNDIESEFEGVVSEIFVKNGDCVEYGQPLFAIG